MKLILIARVSDVEQRKALPAQKLRLIKYAEEQRLPYEYHEFDESAYKDVRRKFAALIQDIKAQKERCIVVFDKIDRFSRDSSQEEVKAMNDLIKKDLVELHFPSDNLFITKDSPATDLFRLGIGIMLAKYYSDSSRDNVKRRFEQLINDKTWIGYAPIGYMNVVVGGTAKKPIKDIIVDTTRAPHIAKMFEMRAIGLPYAHIAKYLNEQGLTTKSGKKLSKSVVEKTLRNPFYYGNMLYKGGLYPHRYEPLISRQLFNKCQAIREKRHDRHATYDSLEFTFKDMAVCKLCGCAVTPYNSRTNVYLKCSGAKTGCRNQNTAQWRVMPDVVTTLGAIPFPNGVMPLIIDQLKSRHDNQQSYYTHNIQETRNDYDKIKDRLKALTYERLDGRITTDLYDEIVTELTAQQQELNDRLISLTDSNKSFLVTASYLLDLAQRASGLFENASERLQQKLLKFILSNMELADQKLTYLVNDPYKIFIELNKKALTAPESVNWCG
jgi:DNA invertase Pin-like site-specific DNA recombinase